MFYRFARRVVWIFFHLIYKIEVKDMENVPQDDGALICPNHYNNFDPLLVAIVLKRKIRFMAKHEAFKNPILRFILNKLETFPVKRGEVDLNAVKTTLRILKDKQLVGLFPEGTRIKGGELGRANSGVAVFATKSGKPVIPVYISGSYRPFSRMRLVFGKPMIFEASKDKKLTGDDFSELSQLVMKEIKNLKEANS